MKRKSFVSVFLAVFILFVFSGCEKQRGNLQYDRAFIKPIKKARQELFLYMVCNQVPGCAVAVSIDGKTVWEEGLGLASKELNAPVTLETKFRVGSVSKLFTSLVYYMLIEKGGINGDSLVSGYFPEFASKKYPVRLKNLASETSGIRQPLLKERKRNLLNVTIANGLNLFKNDSLLFEPGAYEYPSPYNYNLLGAIIEKNEGKDFKKIVKAMLLDTLQMENTVPDFPAAIIKNRSDFYDRDFISRLINAPSVGRFYLLPSEGYLSTPDDILKLGNALLMSEYFSDSLKSMIYKPFTLNNGNETTKANGWGIFKSRYDQSIIYLFAGGTLGGSTHLIIHPKTKMVIAISANLNDEIDPLPSWKIWKFFDNNINGRDKHEDKEKGNKKGPDKEKGE